VNLEIKGWENVPDHKKQRFFLDLEAVLNEYKLFGVFE
jgi:hypothetical protein